MATLISRITSFIQQVGPDIKALNSLINQRGLPAGGTTGQALRKSSSSDYVTEWYTPPAAGALIDDVSAPATDKVWSSSKTNTSISTAVTTAVNGLLNGAGAAYDTLKELQDLLVSDQTAVNGLVTAVGTRVDTASVQSFTTPQKLQARQNIDAYGSVEIGNPDTDFVSIYNTAKA